MTRRPPRSTLFPYPPLFRSAGIGGVEEEMDFALARRRLDLVAAGDQRPRPRLEAEPVEERPAQRRLNPRAEDRKSTRLNSSHANISYAVFCLKKKQHTFEQL